MSVQDAVTGKVATGAAVVGAFLGLTISEWAALATLIFVIFQIIVISPKVIQQISEYWRAFKRWRSKRKLPKE